MPTHLPLCMANNGTEWTLLPRHVAEQYWSKVVETRRTHVERMWADLVREGRALGAMPADTIMTGWYMSDAVNDIKEWAVENGWVPPKARRRPNRSAFKAWCHTTFGDQRTLHFYLRTGVVGAAASAQLEQARQERARLNEDAKRGIFPEARPRPPDMMPKAKARATDRAPDIAAAAAASRRSSYRAAANIRYRLRCQQHGWDACSRCGWWGMSTECVRCGAISCAWHQPEGTLQCAPCDAAFGSAPVTPLPVLPAARPRPPSCEAWVGHGRACRNPPDAGMCTRCNRWLCDGHSWSERPVRCYECPQRGPHGLPVEPVSDRWLAGLPQDRGGPWQPWQDRQPTRRQHDSAPGGRNQHNSAPEVRNGVTQHNSA